MLRQLRVQNLALVDEVELDFASGLNVLTGETGAGKSVLVGALDLILGGKSQGESVRDGAAQAEVEAIFELRPGLAERLSAEDALGEDSLLEDRELLVRRTVPESGRSKVYLNGHLGSVRMLSALRQGVDVTSQHEHVSLFNAERHLEVLDSFGGLEPLREEVGELYARLLGYETALKNLDVNEAERIRREDYLRYSLKEITEIAPERGEIEALDLERQRLASAQDLLQTTRQAEALLYSADGAVVDTVGRIARDLVRLSKVDGALSGLSSSVSGVLAELEELARGLSRYQSGMEANPQRLEALENRRQELSRLFRKYGGEAELFEAQTSMQEELSSFESDEARREDLKAALKAAEAKLEAKAERLTEARQKTVRRFEKAVVRELADLSLDKTRFQVALKALPKVGHRGRESAEFCLSANPGEPLRSLKKTASGGELSRVLIALKRVLLDRQPVETYVFDEVDTGIGGLVADVLGAKLSEIAKSTQVLVVTHLAPVAAYADRHFQVEKGEEGGRTVTRVRPLNEAERIEELARMLGGQTLTEKTRSLAQEMLQKARLRRKKR